VKERLDLMTCAERSGLVIRSFRRSLGRSDRDLKIDEDSLGARSLPEQHIHNIKAEL
jgi:hypothetical protein